MRTTPIIDIIRKYGLTSKRLSPKSKIKYEDAVKAVMEYQNSELKIEEVIDNTRSASHNNCHCGLPGCGQRIRYEYILKSKDGSSAEELVAGSTCVWPTLGLSELEKKDFFNYDKAIREHFALEDWKSAHPTTLEKLRVLEENKVSYYRAFWEEVKVSALTDKDTAFIDGVDVDKELEKVNYQRELSKLSAEDYDKAISYLPELMEFNPSNTFIASLDAQVKSGRKLSGSQLRWLKASVNTMWYKKKIKGTARDKMDVCEDLIAEVLKREGYKPYDFESIDRVTLAVKGNPELSWAWSLYRIKNSIVRG